MSDNFQQEGEINSSDNIISDPASSNVQNTSDISNNAGDVSILRDEFNNRFSGLESKMNNLISLVNKDHSILQKDVENEIWEMI